MRMTSNGHWKKIVFTESIRGVEEECWISESIGGIKRDSPRTFHFRQVQRKCVLFEDASWNLISCDSKKQDIFLLILGAYIDTLSGLAQKA